MNDTHWIHIVRLIGHGWKVHGRDLVSPPMTQDEFDFLEWMSRP